MNFRNMTTDELKEYKKELLKKLKEITIELRKRPKKPSYSIFISHKMYVYLKYSLNNKKKSKYIGVVSEDTFEKIIKIDPKLAPKYLSKLKQIIE